MGVLRVPLLPYRKIDILLFYKTVDYLVKDFSTKDLSVTFKSVNIDNELSEKISNPEKLKILVMTPQQYIYNKKNITKYIEFGTNTKHIGIFLIEDPFDIPTIKLRKKTYSLYENEKIIKYLKSPYSKKIFYEELKETIYNLFLHSSYQYLSTFSMLREIESTAMKDISKAITNKNFFAEDFLGLVLKKSMEITYADAGFIFKKENSIDTNSNKKLSTINLLNKSIKFTQKNKILNRQKIHLKKNCLDSDRSKIAKFIVEEKTSISWVGEENIDSTNNLVKKFSQLPEIMFDQKTYKIKSYCAFPIMFPSGEIEGFILLINKRVDKEILLDNKTDIDNYVTKFYSHDLDLLESIANQSAIALEHTKLINDLKNVFESFTAASIIAIESRDPTTKGHSERVATLTVGLAEAVNKTHSGIYAGLEFSKIQVEEIRYASLLHDFGKIGVREHILNKEKKLFPHELERIKSRLSAITDKLHINILESYINKLMIKNESPQQVDLDKIKKEINETANKLGKFWEIILDVNEPSVLSQEFFEKISEMAATKIIVGQESLPILTPKEIEVLSIKRGSLSDSERREIESHVTHSYNFLIQIPWSIDLKDIPEIVYSHHERLDGSGYPRSLKGKNIPVQARMMAITDIFDALVARDRPYKKAIPYDRAFNILEAEVRNGKLDGELFKIFLEAKVGDLIIDQNLPPKTSSVA